MSLPPVERALIKEEHLREWKNGSAAFKLPEPVPMLRFLYELCSTMVRGELPFQKCRAVLDSVEFCEKVSEKEVASAFADIVTQMSQDLTMPGEHRARLTKLAKWLVEFSVVPLRLFQERCEEEFLWEAEMIKIKAQELKSKEVRVNTRLLYQQTKFNLLREESEGYAKLVTLLCQHSETSSHNAAATIGIIKSLIGHFDLDPNHVFDIVLECFELLPDNNVFLELIPIFPKSHASQILGFKFQHYQRLEVNDPVPFGLYKLTALLVKENFIDLDSICAHLLPKEEDAFEHYSSFSSKQLDEANKIGKINLAATGKDLMDDDKQGDVTVDLFASLDMDSEAVGERSTEFENNQTLGLLTGFLSVDDWYHAHILFDRLSPLNPVEHIQICNSLFRLIEKSLSSAYDIVRQARVLSSGSSGNGVGLMTTENSSNAGSLVELQKELFQMLAIVGPYLYRDTLLLQKVCRVLRGYYLSASELGRTGEGALLVSNPRIPLKEARSPRQVAMSRIEEALRTCLLPSLQMVPANPAVGMEIWEVMSLLPYEVRYRLYGEWEKEDERIPMLLVARQTAKLDTRRILKRLAKENLKQQGRMVAKLAHANPMTVLRTIVNQIEAYKDMITPVVDAFKYLTQLEYDVLEYVVIERLAQGGRDKLKEDGLNLSDWLQSLASFWGHLCKKYPSMELKGLFQYLVNQLKKGQGIELVLLQELIQQMANVHHTEDLTEDQLDAMAGGEPLRHQATGFGVTRHNKTLIKSSNRLRDSLLPKDETKLAIPLLLHLAQHRSLVIVDADAPYIKMICEQFDRCHGALLQYVEFLCSAMPSASAYAQLIPSLDDLVHKYHLEPEVAFLIYRPVMRLFKSPESSDVFWPVDNSDAQSMASSNSESEAVKHSGNVVLDLGSTWTPITWTDLLDTAKTMLPSNAWNSLSPDLYATFWGLTLYDLHVPRNCYESEIAKQKASLKVLEEQPDNSITAITKRKKEKERIQETIDRLTGEFRKHEEHVASVRKRLSREKDKWLSSCLDTLKINMEFLQRCIFPRCTFSMPDAIYCAMFVNTLHSLGTPFFNTVNHMDVLICKTLQPMICCCTESEVGRLGKFLCETLKIAYYWKSDESIYERECGNMPGFAVYYRFPHSQRVQYGQFIKVHWKWSQRITRAIVQCLESTEYMEIRNALIILSKISSVFPATKKSAMNLERRLSKIKGDEREDLKVLATSVGASLAARKPSLVSDEEFCMGFVELKSAVSSKSSASNVLATQSVPSGNITQSEPVGGRAGSLVSQHPDSVNSARDHVSKTKPADGRMERAESIATAKSDQGHSKLKGGSLVNGSDAHSSVPSSISQSGTSRPTENQVHPNEISNRKPEENMGKTTSKNTSESELRAQAKRSVPSGSVGKSSKQDVAKDDSRSTKAAAATNVSPAITANGGSISAPGKGSAKTSLDIHGTESRVDAGSAKFSNTRIPSSKEEGDEVSEAVRPPSSRFGHSPRHDSSTTISKSSDKLQKRSSPADETDRQSKRRKGEAEMRDFEGDARSSDRERSADPRLLDLNKSATDDKIINKATEKSSDRSKDKVSDRHDKEHRERLDRPDKSRGDDLAERSRDRSMERHGRDHSAEKLQERGVDRSFDRVPDKSKDDKGKGRYNDISTEKSHVDDRYHGQSLPPPPPLPPHIVPQSVSSGRRDEDSERRIATTRHTQRLSPRHDEKERRRSEENSSISQDDSKRRREDDFRERKRDDREGLSIKVEERERERDRDREREKEKEKANLLKEGDQDAIAASKRRKLKREHLPSVEAGEYSPAHPPPAPLTINLSQHDGRDRERKASISSRTGYVEEPSTRMHSKEVASKMTRRDTDPIYDLDDDKRQRADQKRRHRKN